VGTDLAELRRGLGRGLPRRDAAGVELARVTALLDAVAGAAEWSRPQPCPPAAGLGAALDLAERAAPALAAALRPVAQDLPWRCGYAPRPDAPGLEAGLRWAELVGPQAPWHSDEVCLGLLLLGPGLFYPPHRHPAVELYRILAGTAAWTIGTITLPRGPGDTALHRSGEPPAMRTAAAPLLAIYTWTGDVMTASAWCDAPVRPAG
jgi:hypothetical protein